MSPLQFKHLREGDLIRDERGHGFIVIYNDERGVIAQNTLLLHEKDAHRWNITGRLSPCIKVPTPRPSEEQMVQDILKAGFSIIQRGGGKTYKSNIDEPFKELFYPTLEAAWDAIQTEKAKPMFAPPTWEYPSTLQELEEQLAKGGWKRDLDCPQVWHGPTGQRAVGSKDAWRIMKGID